MLGGGCGQRRGRPARAEGVRRGRAGRGRGRGPRRQCRPGEPVARPRSPLSLRSPLACRSPSFFLLFPSRPCVRRGGRTCSCGSAAAPRRASTGCGRDAPDSLRRPVRPGPASSVAAGGVNVFSLRRSAVSEQRRRWGAGERGGGLDPSPEGTSNPWTPRMKWRESGGERLALPVPLGPGPPECGWRRVAGGRARGARERDGLCAPAGGRTSASRARGAPRRLPRPCRRGPAPGSHFQVYLCPFQFSVTFREGETKQKSLYFFPGLVK